MKKTARDALLLAVVAWLAIVVFEILLVRALGEFASELTDMWFSRTFLRNLIKALVGADLAENITPTALVTIGFAHPFLYAMVWGFLITTCTRVVGGEIERGTADLLLTLPISRARVFASVTVVWLAAGIPLCLAPLLGVWLGELVSPLPEPLDLKRLVMTLVNLFTMYLAIGGGTMLVSSLIARRGTAVAVVLALLLSSFVLSFLAQFWPVAERLSFLGILDYYGPAATVRSGIWPLRDIVVLSVAAALCWAAGLGWFSRRDIPAA
jgi:ABC-2 type transport system permease protein